MLFNSHLFIFIFLPITWCIFQLVKRINAELPLYWLTFSSLIFYGYWQPIYLYFLCTSILCNYTCGTLLTSRQLSLDAKGIILTLGITANLISIAYFKYSYFILENIHQIIEFEFTFIKLGLPLAISFFTFQQITYLIDTKKGLINNHKFIHYCLYVTFFPQLIAGPIVHHSEILPQILANTTKKIRMDYLATGITIFFIGLFKKVVIADTLSPIVSTVFSAAELGTDISLVDAWGGALAYTFQLYFDFSGYADMAIGIALLFGIKLPINFQSPYKARNIIDFWRYWHMTLSRFLRDYLYIPLGGNKKGRSRRYINLFITMLIGGLWHGAGWTFVTWGAIHGLYLVVNHLWLGSFPQKNTTNQVWIGRILTFLAVVFAWVVFRASDIPSAITIISTMLGFGIEVVSSHPIVQTSSLLILPALLAWVWLMPNSQQLFPIFSDEENMASTVSLKWQANRKWLTFSVLIALASILNMSQVSEFLYFQF